MVIILKAKVKEQCEEKNSYIRECEKLENTEWDLTAYMYKYEKVETIEKLLKLTDKHQNITINSSLLNRVSVVREEQKKTHTYFNHYDPVTGQLVLQFKKTDASIKAGKDKPRYYNISVGYTAHMEILKPFLKTEFTERDLGCVLEANSMFNFRPPPKTVPVAEPVAEPVKAKKVKKVLIDDDPVLPNEPQHIPVAEPVAEPVKAKKVKKVLIDDDPVLPNEPQHIPIPKKPITLKEQVKELHNTIQERVVNRLNLVMKNYNDYDDIENLDDSDLRACGFYENARDVRMNGKIEDNNEDIFWELIEENDDWKGIVLSSKVRKYMLKYMEKNDANWEYYNEGHFDDDKGLIYYYASTWGRELERKEEYFIHLVKNYVCDDGSLYTLK